MHRKYYHYLLFIAHPIHRHSFKAFKKQSKYVVSCYLCQDAANVYATSWGECLPKCLQGRALRVTDAERREDKEMVKEICGERCTAEPETHTLSWVPPPSPPFLYTKLSPAHRQNTHVWKHKHTPLRLVLSWTLDMVQLLYFITRQTGQDWVAGQGSWLPPTSVTTHHDGLQCTHAHTHACMHPQWPTYLSELHSTLLLN